MPRRAAPPETLVRHPMLVPAIPGAREVRRVSFEQEIGYEGPGDYEEVRCPSCVQRDDWQEYGWPEWRENDDDGDGAWIEHDGSVWSPPCGNCECTPRNACRPCECVTETPAVVVARELYEQGFSSVDRVQPYHSGYRVTGGRFARVEHDGSCGGEVIHAYLRLDTERRAERFAQALGIVEQHALCDASCGGHIHVDAGGEHPLSPYDVATLYGVYSYLEGCLYRLGASQYGGEHRTVAGGDDYAPVVPKGLSGAGLLHLGQDRYGLNIGNYLTALQGCTCDARDVGMPETCTCNRAKRTVEFRVWDGTTDPRRVHAYLALSVAMVEWSRGRKFDARRMPAWEFDGRVHVSAAEKRAATSRLRFILRDLPLTDDERADVVYCARLAPGLAPLVDSVYDEPAGFVSLWDGYTPSIECISDDEETGGDDPRAGSDDIRTRLLAASIRLRAQNSGSISTSVLMRLLRESDAMCVHEGMLFGLDSDARAEQREQLVAVLTEPLEVGPRAGESYLPLASCAGSTLGELLEWNGRLHRDVAVWTADQRDSAPAGGVSHDHTIIISLDY